MRIDELLWRAGRYGEDPTEAFLERLQRQFPGHTAERIREFQEFRRGRDESLLTYYNRLINVAEDVRCSDSSLLISKFLGGLDEALGGGLGLRVYELGAEARLEDVFDLAEKVELAQRRASEAGMPRCCQVRDLEEGGTVGIAAGAEAMGGTIHDVREITEVEGAMDVEGDGHDLGHEGEEEGAEQVPQGAWTCRGEGEEKWKVGDAMSERGKEAMQQLLAKHRKCFAFTLQELGRCKVKEMELKLSSTEPVFHRRRKMPQGDEEICKEKIKELLEVGLIRRSESEYATPTVVAARKDLTGEVLSRRMCGDYRALNKITVADRYLMLMAEEIFDKLADGVFFTTLDLSVLRGVECAACNIDDVVIFSTTEQQHLQDVETTLTAIETAGLTCHPKKCRWGEQTMQYLGYEVKGGQIGIQQAKVEVLDRLREPKDKSRLRAVLGFLSYYRQFVLNFSK
ncbi:unnamed protein product [Closterium sp. NIES-53]